MGPTETSCALRSSARVSGSGPNLLRSATLYSNSYSAQHISAELADAHLQPERRPVARPKQIQRSTFGICRPAAAETCIDRRGLPSTAPSCGTHPPRLLMAHLSPERQRLWPGRSLRTPRPRAPANRQRCVTTRRRSVRGMKYQRRHATRPSIVYRASSTIGAPGFAARSPAQYYYAASLHSIGGRGFNYNHPTPTPTGLGLHVCGRNFGQIDSMIKHYYHDHL
jgi:hypothetical protein